MTEQKQTVFIIDDDEAVRDSLQLLLRSVGLRSQSYASAQAFLQAFDAQWAGCLVLDVRMPGMSGLDLAHELREQASGLPIIFISGHGDVPMAVEAMRLGAMDFIQKPFRDQELLDRINEALVLDAQNRASQGEIEMVRSCLATLTPRECQVLEMMLEGKANKVIAIDLDLSQRTVEIHRARIMEKMQVNSLALLVQRVMKARSA